METIKETIRKNLVRLIKESSKTQKKIASDVGVTEPTLYRWKSGEHSPEIDNIVKLAEALDVDPWEFYQKEEGSSYAEPVSKALRKMMCVPDKIYNIAEKYGAGHEVWKDIEKAFEIYEMTEALKAKKSKDA